MMKWTREQRLGRVTSYSQIKYALEEALTKPSYPAFSLATTFKILY